LKPIELIFFGVAILLPLVGGGGLLYLLSRGSKTNETNQTGKVSGTSDARNASDDEEREP
jgi:hypothetical protein